MSMSDDIKAAMAKFDENMTLYNVAISDYNSFYTSYIRHNFKDSRLAREAMIEKLNSTVFISDLEKDDDNE